MKIGLINTYSYNNVGDAAIYAALTKMLSEHEVYTTLDGPGGMQVSESLDHCEGFISVGGDIFNNSRPWSITRNFLSNLSQLNESPASTFLFGQSIPSSCRGFALKLLADRLKKISSVTVRDRESFELLSGLGVPCTLSYDTAFVLESSDAALHAAHTLLNAMDARYSAVISLREFNALYPLDNRQFVDNMASLSRLLLQRRYQPVLLIQSSVSELDSDWVIAKAIQARCPEVKILDLVNQNSAFPSWELLQAILQVSRIIVAVRYHTAVLAMAAGRTPYNLFYSNKGSDLSKRLDIPGEGIMQFNPDVEIDAIVKSGLTPFEAQSIRQVVRDDFKNALTGLRPRFQPLRQSYEAA